MAVATADEVHPAGWGGVKNWVDPQYKLERPKGYVFQDTLVEGQKPDKGDILGAAVATAGAAIITFWPRPK